MSLHSISTNITLKSLSLFQVVILSPTYLWMFLSSCLPLFRNFFFPNWSQMLGCFSLDHQWWAILFSYRPPMLSYFENIYINGSYFLNSSTIISMEDYIKIVFAIVRPHACGWNWLYCIQIKNFLAPGVSNVPHCVNSQTLQNKAGWQDVIDCRSHCGVPEHMHCICIWTERRMWHVFSTVSAWSFLCFRVTTLQHNTSIAF